MTGETIGKEGFLPTLSERDELFKLLRHSKQWASGDEVAADPNADLYAMADVGNRYGSKMPETSRRHLKRMIVLQSELIADINHDIHESLRNSISLVAGPEKSEFRAFNDDLSDLTQPWKCALEDVLVLLGVLDTPPEV